ncbi:MAG: hypothetical protein MRY57_02925, partial [Candidatus Pacebacteria bacterium]|nr:hypothetical protein [Candidatus Paceibacterota bacterium]
MKQIIKFIIGVCITLFLFYLWTPDINVDSWGFWFTLLAGGIVIALMGLGFDDYKVINLSPLILIII